jgi:hypothetical protein
MCPNCYHTVPVPLPVGPVPVPTVGAFGSPPPPPVMSTPHSVGGVGPGWYGPFARVPLLVRWWWLPAALVAVAAGLIMANAIALLSPAFALWWSGIFPWVVALAAFNFIIGIILSLILFGAVLMIFLRFRVLAAFIIFPTAIVSIFFGGGGGFFGGAILAVLGGLLLLLQ